MNERVTDTQYEREAMFNIPPADTESLPKCTRNPSEIVGDIVWLYDVKRQWVPVEIFTLPTVQKEA